VRYLVQVFKEQILLKQFAFGSFMKRRPSAGNVSRLDIISSCHWWVLHFRDTVLICLK